jgi:hypothetical protein
MGTDAVVLVSGKERHGKSSGCRFVAGGILARHSGPRAVLGGGLAFAAFSAAIDLFLRREPAE